MNRKNTGVLGWGMAAVAAVLLAAAAMVGVATGVQARTSPEASPPLVTRVPSDTITLAALPPQGRDVMAQIRQGGPFRYEKDGTVFGNRERLLPRHKRGFYREYTVPTPGLRHRGARRIVCGGTQVRAPEACYYTEDHYASFRRIVQ